MELTKRFITFILISSNLVVNICSLKFFQECSYRHTFELFMENSHKDGMYTFIISITLAYSSLIQVETSIGITTTPTAMDGTIQPFT